MELLSEIAIYLTLFFATVFLIGIIRPDFVVFWSATKSRRKVAALYGTLAVVFFIVYGISAAQRDDSFKGETATQDSATQNP